MNMTFRRAVGSAQRDQMMANQTKRGAALRDGGFTLMEMVVAVFIVGVMIAVITPHLLGAGRQATTVACQQNVNAIQSALTEYALENQTLPTGDATEQMQVLVDAQMLDAMPTQPTNATYTIVDPDPDHISVTCQVAADATANVP